jgi:hypothetical protein
MRGSCKNKEVITIKICSVEGCGRKVKGKGMCSAHYQRFAKYGDPHVLKNRWRIKVDFIEENGCFICTSHKRDKHGYLHVTRNGKHYLLHRYIYEQCFGIVSSDLVVRHKCDNPTCINPEHLELGTFLDNMNDKIIRGRVAKGEKTGHSKLNESQVRDIRHLLGRGESLKVISEKYGISKQNICDIKARRSWKHVH